MTPEEQAIINAVLYAFKEGCFMSLRKPKSPSTTTQWIRWGAMQNLHDAVAAYTRVAPDHQKEGQ